MQLDQSANDEGTYNVRSASKECQNSAAAIYFTASVKKSVKIVPQRCISQEEAMRKKLEEEEEEARKKDIVFIC